MFSATRLCVGIYHLAAGYSRRRHMNYANNRYKRPLSRSIELNKGENVGWQRGYEHPMFIKLIAIPKPAVRHG